MSVWGKQPRKTEALLRKGSGLPYLPPRNRSFWFPAHKLVSPLWITKCHPATENFSAGWRWPSYDSPVEARRLGWRFAPSCSCDRQGDLRPRAQHLCVSSPLRQRQEKYLHILLPSKTPNGTSAQQGLRSSGGWDCDARVILSCWLTQKDLQPAQSVRRTREPCRHTRGHQADGHSPPYPHPFALYCCHHPPTPSPSSRDSVMN